MPGSQRLLPAESGIRLRGADRPKVFLTLVLRRGKKKSYFRKKLRTSDTLIKNSGSKSEKSSYVEKSKVKNEVSKI